MADGFYECRGFDVAGTLGKIKRSLDFMTPIFEAVSNSLDATDGNASAPITLTFDFQCLSDGGEVKRFSSVEITDSGVGFTDENYARFLSLNDRSKSALNKGSGRVQFIKAFDRAEYESVFVEDGVLMKRAFSLSGARSYLDRNALVRETTPKTPATPADGARGTRLRLLMPFNDGGLRYFEKSTAREIKDRVLTRFFLRLNGEDDAPQIDVVFRVNGDETERASITSADKVAPLGIRTITVSRKRRFGERSARRFVKGDKNELFQVVGYAVKSPGFTRNVEAFVSRGEIVAPAGLELANAKERVGGFFYVVAITGARVDSGVLETRDGVGIPTDGDFPNEPLFEEDGWDVSLEDVQKEARKACAEIFPELVEKRNEFERRLKLIGERFGFAKSTIETARKNLQLNATEKDVLKKLYDKEIGNAVRKDVKINELLESVKELDPTSATYQEEAKERADRLLELTPEQNKASLAHCFARRKITLELLGDVLNQKLDAQTQGGRGKEESFLHNVLFRQKTNAPVTSDLWILDEEFVYFSGTSDVPLGDVEYDGKKILASLEDCTPTEKEFLQDRQKKRPDILLFPDEGKCVVVELKAPNVNLSKHIGQVSQYASLIFNYSAPEFKFDRFFLYLIGGKIEPRDIYGADEHFQFAPKGGYMFKTQPLRSFTPNRPDGEAYYEIHTYESIYERAKARNKTFLDLLLNDGREE